MAYPKFGAAGTVEEETRAYSVEELEYRDGFNTDIFDLKHIDTLTRSNPSYCAATFGIGKSDNAAKNSVAVPLDTVTLTEEEEITDPHSKATEPETSPVLGDKLTYVDGLIFHRKRQSMTINGRGDPPAGMGTADRGNTYGSAILIEPAVCGGSGPTIDEGSGWFVKKVEVSKTNTDWQKFVVELTKYAPNTADNAQNNMIAPELFTISELDAISSWYKLSRTITLNGDGVANVEETAEIYDDEAVA